MFLAMVLYVQKRNNPNYSELEILRWGEIMQKVMKVNLSPYRDFRDLMDYGIPDPTVAEKMDEKASELRQRIELKKAIYGEDVDLGDDDLMNSNSDEAVFARRMTKDMAKYVRLSEEDQKKLKNH